MQLHQRKDIGVRLGEPYHSQCTLHAQLIATAEEIPFHCYSVQATADLMRDCLNEIRDDADCNLGTPSRGASACPPLSSSLTPTTTTRPRPSSSSPTSRTGRAPTPPTSPTCAPRLRRMLRRERPLGRVFGGGCVCVRLCVCVLWQRRPESACAAANNMMMSALLGCLLLA
jgi:hypothetical protein